MAPGASSGNHGVGAWIERRALFAPKAPGLIVGGETITYGDLAARIRRMANALRSLGVAPGDRVVWVGPNHEAFIELLFATGFVGGVIAPVNHRFTADQISAVIEDVAPKVVVHHSAMGELGVPASVGRTVVVGGSIDGVMRLEDVVAESAADALAAPVDASDLCMLAHTSGTTGPPKAIMLTHDNVTWNAVNMAVTAGLRQDDVTIAIAPFFRTGGTGVNVLPVLLTGGCVIVPSDVGADEVLRLMGSHRVTVGFGNPDLLATLVRSPRWSDVDLSSVRFVITGGAPVPERLIRAFLDRSLPLLQGYGLSEAAPACLLLHADDALEKIGSAGKPLFGVDVRIVDPSGAEVVGDETGELEVRGANVMAGYWNMPDATEQAFRPGGWLRTGDAARIDDEGFLWIVDRIHEAFVVDGDVVHPGDVERVLLTLEEVADAAVVGVSDPESGMGGAAFVVVAEGADISASALLERCGELLDSSQVPRSLVLVPHLPRNSVGKIIREELRAWHERGYQAAG